MILTIAGLILCSLSTHATSQEGETATLSVQAHVKGSTHFVGQGIEIRVGVVGSGVRPKLKAPRIFGREPTLIGQEFRQVASSGIGDVRFEQNLFISRYRLIPERAGVLTIPPFRASLDGSSGASRPVVLMIRALPIEGRPPGFLGGVGKLSIRVEPPPKSIRLGDSFEYQVELTGPGARGSVEPLDLSRLVERVGAGGVHTLPEQQGDDPPSRTFRTRVRPERAGELVVPPLTVAWFDPDSEHYQVAVSEALRVRVEAVEAFDPAQLTAKPSLDAPSGPGMSRNQKAVWTVTASGLVLVLVLVARRLWGRRSRLKSWTHGKLKKQGIPELIQNLEAAQASEVPERVAESLRKLFQARFGRQEGEMTPQEVKRTLLEKLGDPLLAESFKNLAERADQGRFSTNSGDLENLRSLAIERLGRFEEGLTRPRRKGNVSK